MNYLIRKREQKDCKDVAHVVTIAWNETYQGIVPEQYCRKDCLFPGRHLSDMESGGFGHGFLPTAYL